MKESEFNKVFSRRLKYYLTQNNMSQLDLSKRLGVGTTSVSNWCMGTKSPRMDKVDAMCEIFGCRRSDLMEDPSDLHSSTPSLSPDESSLLADYNRLNQSGKEEAKHHMEYLCSQDRYTKNETLDQSGSKRERLA